MQSAAPRDFSSWLGQQPEKIYLHLLAVKASNLTSVSNSMNSNEDFMETEGSRVPILSQINPVHNLPS
jgi:hypothetical protein